MKFTYKGRGAEITIKAESWMARAIQAATSGDSPILNSRSLEDKAVKDMVGALKRYLVESGKAADKAAAAEMVRAFGETQQN